MDRGAWPAIVHAATRVGHDLVTKPAHSSRYEVTSYCSFNLFFLKANDIEHFFMCSFAIRISFLVKFLFEYFADLKNNWIVCPIIEL